MIGDGIRSLCERTEEIARRFCVERNTVIIEYVGDGVEKFVGEGIEELRGRRRGTENYESTVEGNVGIGESSVGDRVRDKKAGIFKRL